MFDNQIIAITGGTGSFGNHVAKQFLETKAEEIRIFSRDEKKQEEMRKSFDNSRLKFYLGDVRDYHSVHQALKRVDFVFHAAALKQVPSCEFYPMEAIRTNILGGENVMAAALANHVRKVIVLSTDKAVYPINAMGQTKALMEKVMVAKAGRLSEDETILCGTRYGNVMGSRGSVIPLFLSQIQRGEPLTVTDLDMTRFLMSLDDAVKLVLHAFEYGNQGDILVQKAPSCTIRDLVLAITDLFNRPDYPVKVIGIRHGEKVYESLVSKEEMARAESLEKYFRISADTRDLNYSQYFSEGTNEVASAEEYTSHNTERLDVPKVKELLMKLDFVQHALQSQNS